MQKLFKKVVVLITALVAVLGIAAFTTACDKGDKVTYAKAGTEITIIVLDENEEPIGPNFGQDDFSDEVTNAGVQFCSVDPTSATGLGVCASIVWVTNENGTVKVSYDAVKKAYDDTPNATGVELHVAYVEGKGYEKDYGVYPIDKIPSTITIKLKKASN